LLRYAPENKSSPRVVTGKWVLKIEKLTTRLNSKTWTIPQIKIHKMCHDLTNQTTDTTQKSRTHVFIKFLVSPLPQSVEKIVNLLHRFK